MGREGRLRSKGFAPAVAVTAALTVLAVAMWWSQMSNGLVETGMRSFTPWGLGIMAFTFFVGLSAGSLACAALPWALGVEGLKPMSKVAVWTSFACAGGAVVSIMADLGQPFRAMEMMVRGNATSPLVWDMVALTVYAVVEVAFLVVLVRFDGERTGAVKTLAWVSLAAMVFLQMVEAGIFASYSAHEHWATPLMFPWFVSTALACGTGLVLVVAKALSRAGALEVDAASARLGMKVFGVFVAVDLGFLAIDTGMAALRGSAAAGVLLAGPLAPFFWCQVACYVVAIVLGLRESVGHAFVAGILAVVGAFCKRVCLVMGGFQVPNLADEGTLTSQMLTDCENGMAAAYSGLAYTPTLPEVGLFVGTVGFVALLVLLGLRFLPLFDTVKKAA